MLDQAGDKPTAPPTAHLPGTLGAVAPGRRAAPAPTSGFHVGRGTLVQVRLYDATAEQTARPITWEAFAAVNADMGKGELRIILADLQTTGVHHGGGGAGVGFTVAVVPASEPPEVSPARMAADAELARLDALICHLGEARRRYVLDTACNAWTLEQAVRDVARAAEAGARAFARRAELA